VQNDFCNTITQQADIFRRLLHVGFGAIKRNDPWFEILTLLGNSTALQAGALPNSQPQGPHALPMVNCMWGP
jgi:hypothetical protein